MFMPNFCQSRRPPSCREQVRRRAAWWPCSATASTTPPRSAKPLLASRWVAGTDVARESADVVLIGNDLMKFVETVRIARNCRAIIFQNFYGTLIVDTIGIGLAAAGFLNPLLAAFIHVASELTFILNSTRLLAPRQAEAAASAMTTSAATPYFK